jgi:hypothetical protein
LESFGDSEEDSMPRKYPPEVRRQVVELAGKSLSSRRGVPGSGRSHRPEGAASGTGKRAARLSGRGARAARRAVGLEAALVDNSMMTIVALDPAYERSLQARVAGPAALLVAKAHKLHDRVTSGRAARLDDKDASDVVRLMQTTRPDEIAVTLSALAQDAIAGPPTTAVLTYIGAPRAHSRFRFGQIRPHRTRANLSKHGRSGSI